MMRATTAISLLSVSLAWTASCNSVITQGGTGAAPCDSAAACDDEDPCTEDVCTEDGTCASTPIADGHPPGAAQTPGDCKAIVCTAGQQALVIDDADEPDDQDDCTLDTCSGGTPFHSFQPAGTPCLQGSGACDGQGICAPVCPDPGPCEVVTMDAATGTCVLTQLPDGTPAPGDVPGDCHASVCLMGQVASVVDDLDVPVTATDCDVESCVAGVPTNAPKPLDTQCATAPSGFGLCDGAGSCVECNHPDQCPGHDDDCEQRTCDGNVCAVVDQPDGTPAKPQLTGNCLLHVCDGAGTKKDIVDDTDKPVDGKQCTADVCTNGVPSNPPLAPGTPCGGAFVCTPNGTCGDICLSDAECMLPNKCGGPCQSPPKSCVCCPSTCAALGRTCGAASDGCFAVLNCDTGTTDGQESDVDCGGPVSKCATRCAAGKQCVTGSDCASGTCSGGTCS